MNNQEQLYELLEMREMSMETLEYAKKYFEECKGNVDDINSSIKSLMDYGQTYNLQDYKISTRYSESIDVKCKPDELPKQFQRVKTTVEADKVALKKAIKETGALIDGVELKADYSVVIDKLSS